ncbi:MAG: hypothetical protein ACHQ5A_11190 [Opitutales bacterium]
MKLFQLLLQRDELLRRAWLANAAYAYHRLAGYAAHIARVRLQGEVNLLAADPAADRPGPLLLAREGSQSVIEEHFLDEDIIELADILCYLSGDRRATEFTFRLEELGNMFLPGLRRELEKAGVDLDQEEASRSLKTEN